MNNYRLQEDDDSEEEEEFGLHPHPGESLFGHLVGVIHEQMIEKKLTTSMVASALLDLVMHATSHDQHDGFSPRNDEPHGGEISADDEKHETLYAFCPATSDIMSLGYQPMFRNKHFNNLVANEPTSLTKAFSQWMYKICQESFLKVLSNTPLDANVENSKEARMLIVIKKISHILYQNYVSFPVVGRLQTGAIEETPLMPISVIKKIRSEIMLKIRKVRGVDKYRQDTKKRKLSANENSSGEERLAGDEDAAVSEGQEHAEETTCARTTK
jgi:hypothetical protein